MENREQFTNSVKGKMKSLLGIGDTSRDAKIETVISNCIDYALEYTSGAEVSENLIFRMAVEDYSRIGAEGVISKSRGSLKEQYAKGYGREVMSLLNSLRKIKTV